MNILLLLFYIHNQVSLQYTYTFVATFSISFRHVYSVAKKSSCICLESILALKALILLIIKVIFI